jgi:hypothetical protein
VTAELCDVIFTAMVALVTITPDAERVFDEHLAFLRERTDSRSILSSPAPSERSPLRTDPVADVDQRPPAFSARERVRVRAGDGLVGYRGEQGGGAGGRVQGWLEDGSAGMIAALSS